jgi:hypothetical protein
MTPFEEYVAVLKQTPEAKLAGYAPMTDEKLEAWAKAYREGVEVGCRQFLESLEAFKECR